MCRRPAVNRVCSDGLLSLIYIDQQDINDIASPKNDIVRKLFIVVTPQPLPFYRSHEYTSIRRRKFGPHRRTLKL
ncbi:hypothetical protein NDU88_005315 [Pleurodeles waltl]|uniref:Uncharacterized protein n=1 Tax=Pleurodeles waltl TaxID=8319 RepID=A0AAV7VMB0_PLEWA|nr:hypothetical protein NDU88_005315 [Pleurodeles waltl]